MRMSRCLIAATLMIGILSPPRVSSWLSPRTHRVERPVSNLYNFCERTADILPMGNDDGGSSSDAQVAAKQQQRQQDNVLDFRIPEPRLLAVDVISVAIAVHLMAFADVMSDPLQFAPPNPSPLPALMERDSILTVCWILSALRVNGYKQETVSSDVAVVKSTAKITAGFAALRILLGLGVAHFATATPDAWEIVRQCYVTAITVGALRFFYGKYNR